MAFAAMALMGCQQKNPFFNYQNWNTPHGTYPFNEIKVEHYMPAFEEGMKQGLAEIDAIVANPEEPTFENTIEAYANSGKLLEVVASCSTMALLFFTSIYGNVWAPQVSPSNSESHDE